MYTHVQFIAHCIYTAFNYVWDSSSQSWKNQYNGLLDQEQDIEAKVKVVEQAIKLAAKQAARPVGKQKILKIFMLPEMFFQSRAGAYEPTSSDLLVKKLQELVKGPEWTNWIFVFGTIVELTEETTTANRDSIRKVSNFTLVQKGGFGQQDPNQYGCIINKVFSSSEFIKSSVLTEEIKQEKPVVIAENYIFEATENETRAIVKLKELLKRNDQDTASIIGVSVDKWKYWKKAIEDIIIKQDDLKVVRSVRDAKVAGNIEVEDWVLITKKLMVEHILKRRQDSQNDSEKQNRDVFSDLRAGNLDVEPVDFKDQVLQELLDLTDKYYYKDRTKCRDYFRSLFPEFDELREKLAKIDSAKILKSVKEYEMLHAESSVSIKGMRLGDSLFPVIKRILSAYLIKDLNLSNSKDFRIKEITDFVNSGFIFELYDDGNKQFKIRKTENVDQQRDRILFGLETCADHGKGMIYNFLKDRGKVEKVNIDIQLVPSAGTAIFRNFVAVRQDGYVFNCDGWNVGGVMRSKQSPSLVINTVEFVAYKNPNDQQTKTIPENSPFKPHSEILKKVTAVYAGEKIKEQDLKGVDLVSQMSVDIQNKKVDITVIFPKGAGMLHFYQPQPLKFTSQNLSTTSSLFPYLESSFALSLSDEPILLNGMKVIFDQPVPVYPVNLQPKE